MTGSAIPMAVPGPMSWPKLFLGLTIWLLIVFSFGALSLGSHKTWTWNPSPPPPGSPVDLNRGDQCEKLNYISHVDSTSYTAKIFEIQNTWSNAAYLLAGILILLCSRKSLGLALGANLCLLAVLSGFYHATLQEFTQTLDIAGVYSVLLASLCYGAESIMSRLGGPRAALIYNESGQLHWYVEVPAIILTPALALLMASLRTSFCLFDSTTGFVIIFVLLFTMLFRQMFAVKGNTGWVFFTVILVVATPGLVFRLLDGDGKPLCLPDGIANVVQGHALWHVFSAATLLLLYDFFAWYSADDWRAFGQGAYRDSLETAYPKWAMATVGFVASAVFLTDSLIQKSIVIGRPAECHLWGIFIAIAFLAVAVLTVLGVIKP
jgi:hypothetical protein